MVTKSWATRLMRGAVAVAAALASVVGGAPPASAVSEEMKPGEVRVIEAFVPSAPLLKPDDPRIRGYGFSAAIEGVSEAVMVEDGIFDFKPPPGHRIVVFGVRFDRHGGTDHARPVRATVVADGRRTAVDFSFGGGEGPLVAVAVATDAAQVQFEMAAAGLAQTFSLTDRKRVGPQPGVLYRDANGPEVVTDVNADRVVRAEDGEAGSTLTVTLQRARLSWFAPLPAEGRDVETPASPDKAFLVVEAEADSTDGPHEEFGTVPGGDVKVRLPNGTVVAGRHAGPADGLLSGAYYFEVPADTTAATVLIGPADVPAKRRSDRVIEATTVRVEQSAFEVTFPVGNVLAPSEPLPTTTPTTAAGGNVHRSEDGEEKGGGGFPAPALVAIAVAVAALAAAAGWRARRPSADPDPAAAEIEGAHDPVGLLALTDSPVVAVAGEGALDAVRAVLHDRGSSGAVVLATAETEPLGDEELPASATVVRDPAAVLPAVEVARLRQARLNEENGDSPGGGVEHAPMVVVVPAALDADQARALRATAESGVGIRLVVVGEGPTKVLSDGRVTAEGQPDRRVVMRAATSQTESELNAPAPVEKSRGGRVTVRVLGPLHVSAAGEVGSGMRSKARELLAFLAVHRDGVTTDAALEALWPEERPEDAYFRTIIGNIRTSLRSAAGLDDSVAVVERSGLRLRLDDAVVDVDLWRFEERIAAAASGEPAAAEEAAEAYRGDLLDGEDFPWSEPIRERLRRRAIDNLTSLAERRRAAGDLDGALHAAERAVERDQYAEELYQRVMELHLAAGRPDGARRTFEALEARLRELDLTPSDKSRRLAFGVGA